MTASAAFYEVIIDHPQLIAPAFGLPFTEEAVATAYATAMEARGFTADLLGPFDSVTTLADALAAANAFFEDRPKRGTDH